MQWTKLTDLQQLDEIRHESTEQKILIFKHSTRCSTSRAMLDRLERNWKEDEMQTVKPYFLDLLSYRQISNAIAEKFNVEHESPQVLIIQNGNAIYHASHTSINYSAIKET
ncbi:MAG: bacillithiol system redox-active protein YtxJ [Cyclobacteriaceae bacterium]|nr:bacillithiol system redox-active protein YtxJ [Cyclobacteriaceae bacterium]UYN87216.1 MAG: bacillithiol system redox-active protein YtxJ [Cyclobacteriaceae bacterium]